MKNFLLKLKTNKISLSFAIASCIAITFVCVISMTLYYTNSKTLINNFLNEKIKSVQSALIEDINEFEHSLVNTSFQILSDDVIYSILSEKNVTAKEHRNATMTLKNQLLSEPVMSRLIFGSSNLKYFSGTNSKISR